MTAEAARSVKVVVAVAAVVAATAMPWVVDAYVTSLASYALVVAVLAASAQILLAGPGLASLGQAAFAAAGAYTAAWCGNHLSADGLIQLAAATLIGGVAAATVGMAVARARGTTFIVLTLALGELASTAAGRSGPLTGDGSGVAIAGITLPAAGTVLGPGPVYLYVLGASVVVLTGLHLALRSDRLGLVLRGVADHEPRMQASGYATARWVWFGYVVAGAVAGWAGSLLLTAHRFVGPPDVGFDTSALALLAAIAGRGSIAATALAAAAIVAVNDVAGGVFTGYSPALLGALFIAAAYTRHRRPTAADTR